MIPGRELDALIAEKVMGLRCPDWISCGRGRGAWEHSLKHYSTDISAAWEVVEKLNLLERFELSRRDKKFTITTYSQYENHSIYVEAPTAPHAVCLAALKVMEGRT